MDTRKKMLMMMMGEEERKEKALCRFFHFHPSDEIVHHRKLCMIHVIEAIFISATVKRTNHTILIGEKYRLMTFSMNEHNIFSQIIAHCERIWFLFSLLVFFGL